MEKSKRYLIPQHIQLLLTLGSMTMFMAMCTDMYLPGFPLVAKALHVQMVDLQLTFTSFTLGVGFGQLIYGPISDRFGRKNPAIFGMVLFVASSVLCATATTLGQLVFYRLLQALGGAAGMVISRAIVRDMLSGVEMAKMMSAMSMIFVFSPAVAPSIGTVILHFATWPWIFLGLGLFGVLVLIGILGLDESLPNEKRSSDGIKQSFKNYIAISKSHEYRSAGLIMAAGTFVTFGFVSSSAAVVMGSYGVSRAKYGYIFVLLALSLVASNRFNQTFLHKFGVIGMLQKFTLVQTVSAVFILIASIKHAPLWLLLIPVLLCFACAPGMGANATTLGMHPFPEMAGSAAAMLGLVQMLGAAAVSAVLAALRFDVVSKMGWAMLLGAIISFIQARRIKVQID
jgi:DHA1 family bicyclomycin/chloramphenicol resistance-like MFS transporter